MVSGEVGKLCILGAPTRHTHPMTPATFAHGHRVVVHNYTSDTLYHRMLFSLNDISKIVIFSNTDDRVVSSNSFDVHRGILPHRKPGSLVL